MKVDFRESFTKTQTGGVDLRNWSQELQRFMNSSTFSFVPKFLLILLVAAAGYAQNSSGKFLNDDEFKTMILLPNGWSSVKPTIPQTRFKFLKDGSDGLVLLVVTATRQPLLKSWTSRKFVDRYLVDKSLSEALVRMGGPSARIIDSGEMTIADRPAFYVKSTADVNGRDSIVYQALFLCEGDSYGLMLSAPIEEFDAAVVDFKKIAAAFLVDSAIVSTIETGKSSSKSSDDMDREMRSMGILRDEKTENWVPVFRSQATGETRSIDPSKIARASGLLKFWIRIDGITSPDPKIRLSHILDRWSADCVEHTYFQTERIVYKADGSVWKSDSIQHASKAAPPGSIAEKLIQWACKNDR